MDFVLPICHHMLPKENSRAYALENIFLFCTYNFEVFDVQVPGKLFLFILLWFMIWLKPWQNEKSQTFVGMLIFSILFLQQAADSNSKKKD